MRNEERIDLAAGMLSVGLRGALEQDAIRRILLERAVEETVLAGDVVVRQGELGDRMYLVLEGRLRAEREEAGETVVLGEVHPGEFFGEISIVRGEERMATVRALTSTTLLSFGADAVQSALVGDEAKAHVEALAATRLRWSEARRYRPKADEIFAALEPFTGPIDAATRHDLEEELHWIAVHRGSEIIKQGTAGDCLYFVVSGRLEVLVDLGNGTASSVAEVGPGESVGEAALLTNEPRGATVRALRDSELLRLSRAGFERLMATHARAMAGLARTVAARLQRSLRQREPVVRMRVSSLATADECKAITENENLVLRNLKITQMYHRLSCDISRLVGQLDANWCTFATAASKTAGYSIRREDVPFLETWRYLSALPRVGRALRPVGRGVAGAMASVGLTELMDEILAEVSAGISAGNLKVFAELAPLFASFVQAFHDHAAYDRGALVDFLDAQVLKGPLETGGQDLLREALSHYYDAMFERSEKARAELILLGTLKVGLHEQTRLQPEIEQALNAPVVIVLRALVKSPGRMERRIADALSGPSREAVTRLLMRFRLPRGDMRIGQDVPRLDRLNMFPDVLRSLNNPELIAFVSKLDNDAHSTVGSYARDWASLEQRMNFIADAFRSRQRSLDLFESPFEYDQRLEMAAERVPAGRL